jgi:glucose-1-phosphate thymidylyltransferase
VKVIIPVAGEGTRLRPHTFTTPKALLQIAGKPILGHIIDQIIDLDISEMIFVTGPQGHKIERFVRETYTIKSTFVEQRTLYGLGYAVHLGMVSTSEDLLVILGDTIVEIDWKKLISSGRNCLAVKEVANPRAFGVVETEGDRIVRLVEKPQNPPTNLAVVGVYYIRDVETFHRCTTEIIDRGVTSHGEIQLTDAFDLLLKKGSTLHTFPTLGWYDCGRKETMLETNRFILDRQKATAERAGCTIVPPVFIAEDAVITKSTIGPYVSIGKGCKITDATIKDSILADGVQVEWSVIEDSLLGNQASVKSASGSFNLGDLSSVTGKAKAAK